MRGYSRLLAAALAVLACLMLTAAVHAETGTRQQVEVGGIGIDFRIDPLLAGGSLREGQQVRIRFTLADATTGTALAGASPAAWMDRLPPEEARDPGGCLTKVRHFLGGSLLAKAELDLNVFYVVVLNDDATLSVVDPLFGFGGSKLLALVRLASPGRDWVLSADRRRLFVTLPETNAVAVVETDSWQLSTNIPTAPAPQRLVLQPDGGYVWVAYDGVEPGQSGSGVAVIQPTALSERKRLVTGRGRHDIALSGDSRYAFISNAEDGTVAVVDVRRLEVVRTLATGPQPVSLAWSEAARSVYVAHAGDGSIVAIDGERLEISARLPTDPGLAQIRATPDGRLVLAVNPETDMLHVIDASRNRVVQSGPVGRGPDQLAFSESLAYIRHRGTDAVFMVPLQALGQPGTPIPLVDFPGGAKPPGPLASLGAAVVRAPGGGAVLVANTADGMIYYYKEGMAAPMGAFQNYGHRPQAVLVRALVENGTLRVQQGAEVRLTLEVSDPHSGTPRAGLSDLEAMVFLAPGHWHTHERARDLGAGRYEVTIHVPEAGLYYVYAESASAGLSLGRTAPVAYIFASQGADPSGE
jgi:DNA-binding beta-propeller fold protein YncE